MQSATSARIIEIKITASTHNRTNIVKTNKFILSLQSSSSDLIDMLGTFSNFCHFEWGGGGGGRRINVSGAATERGIVVVSNGHC